MVASQMKDELEGSISAEPSVDMSGAIERTRAQRPLLLSRSWSDQPSGSRSKSEVEPPFKLSVFLTLLGAGVAPVTITHLLFYWLGVFRHEGTDVFHALMSMNVFVLGVVGFSAWRLTVAWESNQAARRELDRQNAELSREISERRRVERALCKAMAGVDRMNRELAVAKANAEDAARAAEAANLAKSRFVAHISHELRTPLTTVLGYSEILEEDALEHGNPAMVTDLRKIHQAGTHLLGLVNTVLDLSKVEAGRMDLCVEVFDLRELLNEVVSAMRPAILKNGNTLTIDAPPGPFTMRADLMKMRQILLNLVSNAAKFTRHGSIQIQLSGDDLCGVEAARIAIADTGVGMSSEQRGLLFRAYMQADAAISRRYGGTGLGLALTKRFVEMMSGKIEVESQVGVGTTFTVRMPREI